MVGLRSELELRSDLTSLPAYTLLEDVSSEDLSAILELNTPGLTVELLHRRGVCHHPRRPYFGKSRPH